MRLKVWDPIPSKGIIRYGTQNNNPNLHIMETIKDKVNYIQIKVNKMWVFNIPHRIAHGEAQPQGATGIPHAMSYFLHTNFTTCR